MKPPVRYCAVYTRKSSEEGLDQEFNSLDAQRESCLAYIASQKAEGWTAVRTVYDDGGYSGGNMERPGIKQLMEDVQAGKVHIIVVYKIDRLTRSLMDFAKLVEIFDRHGVTFVSVTQSFNTTTSMGRLTLNVLLSFAQFEREVTGERIRDKIAASKKKGIWMGGIIPFGYDLKDRCLLINKKEAELVRRIFQAYLSLRSVLKLKALLDQEGHKTRKGNPFTRGMLYWTLSNPLYTGKLKHKKQVHSGAHEAIVTEEVWSRAQEMLAAHAPTPRGKKKPFQVHLLQGILHDERGGVYSPVFTNKRGKRYRYYVSQNKIQGRESTDLPTIRIPAQEIEAFVEGAIRQNIAETQVLARILAVEHDHNYEALQRLARGIPGIPIARIINPNICKIAVCRQNLTIKIQPAALDALLRKDCGLDIETEPSQDVYELTVPFQVGRSWKSSVVIRPVAKGTSDDIFDLPPYELKNLVRGMIWREEHFKGMTVRAIAQRDGHSDAFVGRLIRNTFDN